MLNHQKREFLKLFLREKIKPLLDQRWEKVLELRGTEDHPFCKEGLILDFFQTVAIPEKGNEKTGTLASRCLCPAPGPWWQVLMAFYTLSAPEIWPSEKEVARDLMLYFDEYGANPTNTGNFEVEQAEHLWLTREGERKNKFLTHPIECCIALYALLWAQGENMEEKKAHMERLIEEKTKELEEWEAKWDLIKGQ